MKSGLFKVAGTIALLAVIGLPIVSLSDFLVFATGFLIVLFSPVPSDKVRWGATAVLVALVLVVKLSTPRAGIEEGQGVYTPARAYGYDAALPAVVRDHLAAEFERRFPKDAECATVAKPCWLVRIGGPRESGFAFSSESLVRPAKYSRVVDHIDFDSRETLPLVALNDLRYNVHPPYSKTWVRRELPYYLVYEFPKQALGGELCWRGTTFWETSGGSFDRIDHATMTCVPLSEANVQGQVIATEALPDAPLAISLQLPTSLKVWALVRQWLGYAAAIGVVALLVGMPSWRRLVLPVGALAATTIWAIILEPLAYTGFRLHPGGADGLGYEAFARQMVEAAAHGDWKEALRGSESIFWSMPGLRYFLAAVKPIFADSFFGHLLATALLPVVVHRLLLLLVSTRAAAILTGLFLLTPVFEFFRFTHYIYVKLATEKGLGETLGYLAFTWALTLVVRQFALREKAPDALDAKRVFFAIGLCGFIAIAMRPNLGPSTALLLVVVGLLPLLRLDWGRFGALCVGFVPISLLGIHNVVYGGKFYLLTETGAHPDNLEMPPNVWLRAFGQLFDGDFSGAAFQSAMKQLHTWNSPDEFYRVIVFFVVLWALFARAQPAAVRLICAMAVVNQAMLFFFHASGRYAFLAWFLTFVAFLPVFINQGWPWLSKRFRRKGAPAAVST